MVGAICVVSALLWIGATPLLVRLRGRLFGWTARLLGGATGGSGRRRFLLASASRRFHIVPFHVVGVVQEFPAAPRDSFMVANLCYLAAADHAAARTRSSPPPRKAPRRSARG